MASPIRTQPSSHPFPGIKARVDSIRTFIQTYRTTVTTRQTLNSLSKTQGLYCPSCSPLKQPPGTCSPTCPLYHSTVGKDWYCMPSSLKNSWIEDGEMFADLVADVQRKGYDVSLRRLAKWCGVVEKLKGGDGNRSEVKMETGAWETVGVKGAEGLDLGWRFEEVWGKGPGIEEEVAPDEFGPGDVAISGDGLGKIASDEVVANKVGVTGVESAAKGSGVPMVDGEKPARPVSRLCHMLSRLKT